MCAALGAHGADHFRSDKKRKSNNWRGGGINWPTEERDPVFCQIFFPIFESELFHHRIGLSLSLRHMGYLPCVEKERLGFVKRAF